jgi:glycosyltransferase involved in cell wall biosynthesis
MQHELWIVSNLPPPVHGVSLFNEALLEEIRRRRIDVRFLRVGSSHGRGVGHFDVWKMLRDAIALWRLVLGALTGAAKGRPRILYFTPSQWGPAIMRDVAVSTIGRLLFDRVVAHIHGCGWLLYQERGGILSKSMRYSLERCDKVICLGPTFTNAMRKATGLDCIAVNNGVRGFASVGAKRAPDTTNPVRLLFLGNFIPSKGLWAAAEATEYLRKAGMPVILRCAGAWRSDNDQDEFTRRFHPGPSSPIKMVGLADQESKERLLREAHFLVLPTSYPFEGQPLVIIEALSAGVLPVVTTQGGISDLMQFEGANILVSTAHASGRGVAKTIQRLVGMPDEYEALSQRCIDWFRSGLTFDRCADQVLSVVLGDTTS